MVTKKQMAGGETCIVAVPKNIGGANPFSLVQKTSWVDDVFVTMYGLVFHIYFVGVLREVFKNIIEKMKKIQKR